MKKTIIFSIILLGLFVVCIYGLLSLRPTIFSMLPEEIPNYDELKNQIYIEATIEAVNENFLVIGQTESSVTRVPITADTLLIDSAGKEITLSQFVPGQRVQLCVSSSVREQVISNLIAENTYQEIGLTVYQKCYEVKIIEP